MCFRKCKSLILACFLFVSNQLIAQSDEIYPFHIGVRQGGGFIIAHNATMEFLANRHISTFELYVEQSALGNQKWHSRLNFPRLGIALNRFDLNNTDVLGNGYSIAPYLSFSLIKGKIVDLNFRGGIGAGWIEEPFDRFENFRNIAIGSNLNIFFSFLGDASWHISHRLDLKTAISFSHFSNTAFSKPNLGINMPGIQLGMAYSIGEKTTKPVREIEAPLIRSNYQHFIQVGWGINESSADFGQKYAATALSYMVDRQVNHKSRLGGNLDIFYNPALQKTSEANGVTFGSKTEGIQLGLGGTHSLVFGKLHFFTELGFYVISKHTDISRSYQRLGGRYICDNNWTFNFNFKTHLSKAEYIGAGFGYRIKK